MNPKIIGNLKISICELTKPVTKKRLKTTIDEILGSRKSMDAAVSVFLFFYFGKYFPRALLGFPTGTLKSERRITHSLSMKETLQKQKKKLVETFW